MFHLNKDKELTVELLHKMINKFNIEEKPRLDKFKRYYDGLQVILLKTYADKTKLCSRVVTNYCKNIVDSYCGYIASPGHISYNSEQDIEEIMNVLRYNDYQAADSALLLDALVYGRADELMYTDEDGQTRYKIITPTQCFGIYDDSLTNDLLYFVRMYKASEWDDSNTYNVDVYSSATIKHYTMAGTNGFLIFVNEEPHYFNQCPANEFELPDGKSIFECIISLQDAFNEILSSEIDDYSAFCDAYMTLEAVDAEDEEIKAMKENKVLLLPQGGKAGWLTKNFNDAQVENMLKRINDNIYKIAACPDFSSESFVGGVSSGIAIQYRLTGMETRAAKIEAEMKKALQRRVEIISGIASLRLGEEVFRDIEIKFKRNIPQDEAHTINMINSLKGTVSDATLISQLPFVQDVNKEIEAVNEQKKANMITYGFGLTNTTPDEEDGTEDE